MRSGLGQMNPTFQAGRDTARPLPDPASEHVPRSREQPGGQYRGLRAVAQAKLAKDLVDVLVHRRGGDAEALRDLPVGTRPADLAQDLQLARAERLECVERPAPRHGAHELAPG